LPRDSYNVFIVVLDSLRADHVEPNGAVGVATPRIAGLAEAGVTFLGARSSASWTRPAIATLFTSLSPSTHGVQNMKARLPRQSATLPALLRGRGYRTVGITNNVMVSRGFGFARGFDELHHLYSLTDADWRQEHESPESRAAFVWDRYIAPLVSRDSDPPFLVYLHEIDPHSPYEPTEAYDELYDFGYRGNLTFDLATTRRIRNDPTWAAPADIRHFKARYRGEITSMDRYVGWLLDRLDREGLAERTLFVLISDHGEEFMEHRSVGHGHALYEELLRIPLVVRLPAALPAGVRVDVGAQLIDLAPTILDLIGADIPDAMEGVSLLPYLAGGGGDLGRRPAFAVSQGPRHASVRIGDWKLIVDRDAGEGAPDQHQLFDLRSDPSESLDRWAREPVVGRTLLAVLDAKLREDAIADSRPAAGPDPLAPDVVDSLRALGYVD
jgi:arylsulfatase A-like enzyme